MKGNKSRTKYIVPLLSMLACSEIVSTIALLVLVCMVLSDIASAAEKNKI